MKFQVYIVNDAEEDLFQIYQYIALNDTPAKAEKIFQKLKETCLNLKRFPKRGHCPPELEHIGVFDFLEIHYKPYRIVYQIFSTNVYVHCSLDGRRDLQDLLQIRLLR